MGMRAIASHPIIQSSRAPAPVLPLAVLEKIKKIRKWGVDGGYDFDIEVDGGVKADWTIAQVRARF